MDRDFINWSTFLFLMSFLLSFNPIHAQSKRAEKKLKKTKTFLKLETAVNTNQSMVLDS